MPLFSLNALVSQGLLDAKAVPVLRDLRQANALLFDFVLKRAIAWKGHRFGPRTFETRSFFEARA